MPCTTTRFTDVQSTAGYAGAPPGRYPRNAERAFARASSRSAIRFSCPVVVPGTHAASTASSTAITIRPASFILASSRLLLITIPMGRVYLVLASACGGSRVLLVVPVARGLNLGSVLVGPNGEGEHGLEERSAELGERVVDARRNRRVDGARHHAVALEAAQRERQHPLRNALDGAAKLAEALRAVAE